MMRKPTRVSLLIVAAAMAAGAIVAPARASVPSASRARAALAAMRASSASPGRPARGGDEVWVSRYNGPGDATDQARAVAVSPDGSKVFVTGMSYSDETSYDYQTIAYDAVTGLAVWEARYGVDPTPGSDEAIDLAVSPDGSVVFVTGSSQRVGFNDDFATIAYDADTRAMLWLRRYDGPDHSLDDPLSLAVSPDGSRVFVTGASIGAETSWDFLTAAYGAETGSPLWVRRFNAPVNDQDCGYSLAVSPDGSRVFVTGRTYNGIHDSDAITLAYDASTGVRLWVQRYHGPGAQYDAGVSIAASRDGPNVFVVASSYLETQVAYAT